MCVYTYIHICVYFLSVSLIRAKIVLIGKFKSVKVLLFHFGLLGFFVCEDYKYRVFLYVTFMFMSIPRFLSFCASQLN